MALTAGERSRAHYRRYIDQKRRASRDRYAARTEEQREAKRARDRARYALRGATARAEGREKGRRRRRLVDPILVGSTREQISYSRLVSALSSWSKKEHLRALDGERFRDALSDHDEWLESLDVLRAAEEAARAERPPLL